MKLILTPAEMSVLSEYGIRNFEQLREIVYKTKDERLMPIFTKSVGALFQVR